MKDVDVVAIKHFLNSSISLKDINPRKILLLSPSHDEEYALWNRWPRADISSVTKDDWDFATSSSKFEADLALACNVFMYSENPALWLENISRSVKYLIMQDLAIASRSPNRYLAPKDVGGDGDCQRYSISGADVIGLTDPGFEVFDLSTCGYSVLDTYKYTEDNVLKFVTLLDLNP